MGWLNRLSRRQLLALAAAIALTASMLLWGVLALDYIAARRHAEDELLDRSNALIRNIGLDLSHTVETADQILRFLQATWRRDPVGFDVASWSRAAGVEDTRFALSLLNADGSLRATSAARPPPGIQQSQDRYDLADREQFRIHLSPVPPDPTRPSERVGAPLAQRWVVQFTRPVPGPGRAAQGLLMLSLDLRSFEEVYELLRFPGATVMLVSAGGRVWARAPERLGEADLATGQSLPAPLFAAVRDRAPSGFPGADEATLTLSREVPKLPFFVLLTANREQAAAGITDVFIAAALRTALATLIFGVLLWLLRRATRSTDRRWAILRQGLEYMPQGVVLADATGRVRFVNGWLRRRLDAAGLSGDGGTLAGLVRALGGTEAQPTLFETPGAGGTPIETRRTRLPGGGTLLTSTERVSASGDIEPATPAPAPAPATATAAAPAGPTPRALVFGVAEALERSGLSPAQASLVGQLRRIAGRMASDGGAAPEG